jgi:osmotically-inducible protein OsmY
MPVLLFFYNSTVNDFSHNSSFLNLNKRLGHNFGASICLNNISTILKYYIMAEYNRNQGGSNRNQNQDWNENRGRNKNQENDQNWNSGDQNYGGSSSSEWNQSRSQSRHQRDDYGRSTDYGQHNQNDFNSGNYGNDRPSGYSSYYGSDSNNYGSGNSGNNYGNPGSPNYGSSYGTGGSSQWNRDRNLYDRDYQGMSRSGYSNSGTRTGGSNYGSGSYGDRDKNYYRGNENHGGYSGSNYGGNYGNVSQRDTDRNWWDRASDEVSSWFGDDDAERRRERDKQISHRGRGPKNYNRSDDRIKEDINDKLSDDPFIDASDIDVTVANAEVTLTGTVDHRSTKRRAEDLAEAVSGVKNVENRIRVASTASMTYGTSGSGSTGSSSLSGTTGTTSGTESTTTSGVAGSDRSRTAKKDFITG